MPEIRKCPKCGGEAEEPTFITSWMWHCSACQMSFMPVVSKEYKRQPTPDWLKGKSNEDIAALW